MLASRSRGRHALSWRPTWPTNAADGRRRTRHNLHLRWRVQQDTGITAVAHAIQLAVAPVFLLSGIGAMLAVLTNRLSRIIDRGRVLDGQLATSGPDAAASIRFELQALTRRAPARNPDRYRKPPHRPTLGRPRAAPAAA